MKTPFFNIADPTSGLYECAEKLLAERRERYLLELNRLHMGRARRNDLAGKALVQKEIHRVSTRGSAQVLNRGFGFSRLRRAQLRFERDTQLILAHLPRTSSPATDVSVEDIFSPAFTAFA
jgi:hypothetical protein